MMDLLFASLLLGYAAAGAASILRALAPTLWLLHKPLSCDLCMSWWSSLVLSVLLTASVPMSLPATILVLLSSTANSIMVLKINNHFSGLGLPPQESEPPEHR